VIFRFKPNRVYLSIRQAAWITTRWRMFIFTAADYLTNCQTPFICFLHLKSFDLQRNENKGTARLVCKSVCQLFSLKVSLNIEACLNRTDVMQFVLFCFSAVLDARVGHTMDVLSPFISILCHSHSLCHRKSCPRLDVYPSCA